MLEQGVWWHFGLVEDCAYIHSGMNLLPLTGPALHLSASCKPSCAGAWQLFCVLRPHKQYMVCCCLKHSRFSSFLCVQVNPEMGIKQHMSTLLLLL